VATCLSPIRQHRVRRVDAASGIITTVAGKGVAGFSVATVVRRLPRSSLPERVAVDEKEDLYIADTGTCESEGWTTQRPSFPRRWHGREWVWRRWRSGVTKPDGRSAERKPGQRQGSVHRGLRNGRGRRTPCRRICTHDGALAGLPNLNEGSTPQTRELGFNQPNASGDPFSERLGRMIASGNLIIDDKATAPNPAISRSPRCTGSFGAVPAFTLSGTAIWLVTADRTIAAPTHSRPCQATVENDGRLRGHPWIRPRCEYRRCRGFLLVNTQLRCGPMSSAAVAGTTVARRKPGPTGPLAGHSGDDARLAASTRRRDCCRESVIKQVPPGSKRSPRAVHSITRRLPTHHPPPKAASCWRNTPR